MDASVLGRIIDQQAIVDTVVRWAQSLDAKDWPGARSCFTDEIETDYTDLRGTHYTHTLVRTLRGWKITRVHQSVAWNRGNPAIHAGARSPADGPQRGGP